MYICFCCKIDCVTSSWSRWALSIAFWQKTPVMTLRTANWENPTKPMNNATLEAPTSLRGSTTSTQLIPPVADMKRVNMLRGTLDQYFSSGGALAMSSSKRGSPESVRCSATVCVKKVPKRKTTSVRRTRPQISDWIVYASWWTRVRRARMSLMMRITRTTRMSLATLSNLKIRNCDVLPRGADWVSSSEKYSKPNSSNDVTTMKMSNALQCKFSKLNKRQPSKKILSMSSMVKMLVKTVDVIRNQVGSSEP
mmetsp:Transcript_100923/g.290186  ORF Transcript_100923/g.290186 Transcript_100923/m.290186 type:complete len:252 (-) Transcript_100923:536-1291(-)